MAPVQHEGWAKLGDKIVMVSHRGARAVAQALDVTRVTKTQIELSNGGKLRWDGKTYDIPGRGTWDPRPDIYPILDPRVPPIMHAQRLRNVHANLTKAVAEFDPDKSSRDDAEKIAKLADRLAQLVAETDR